MTLLASIHCASLPQEALASYDATLSAFQRSENMKEIGWTGAMKTRWRDAKSINGRDRIRAAIKAHNCDALQASGLDRGSRAQRHRVIPRNNPADLRMRL